MATRPIPIPRDATVDAPIPIPQGATVDGAAPKQDYGPFHLGFENGFAQGLGVKPTDPADPHSTSWGDIGRQVWDNIRRSASESYAHLGGASDEQLSKAPVYRIDVPLRSAAAMVATPFDMMASGINGMASTLQSGSKDLVDGLRSGDHEKAGRGFGQVLAAASQVAMGMDESPAGAPNLARNVGKITEYAPRSVDGAELTGKMRPANIAQGAINRSVGALARDVRFGDPSAALVEEGINWPATKGRLAQVNGKLSQLGPKLNNALQNAAGAIDLDSVLDPIIKTYKNKIRLSNESAAVKQAAYDDLATLRDTAHEHAPSGTASVSEANSFKQAIGDSVNWEKRPVAMHDLIVDAYKEAYSSIRNKVNNEIGPTAADLNRRISNLKAAQAALREQATQIKAGRAPGFDLTHPLNAAKSAGGSVAPGIINVAQDVASVGEPASRIAAAGAVPTSTSTQP